MKTREEIDAFFNALVAKVEDNLFGFNASQDHITCRVTMPMWLLYGKDLQTLLRGLADVLDWEPTASIYFYELYRDEGDDNLYTVIDIGVTKP